jgi:Tfp pilus assembly protein PilN
VIPPAPNLARRPFANTRPAVRAAIFLWLAGALLLAFNLTVYSSYYVDSADMRAELAAIERKAARERSTAESMSAALAGLDLERQNEQVEFLNRKIAERAFSWSLLFDRLAEVLPDEVRLTMLRPQGVVADEEDSRRRRGERAEVVEEGRVGLEIVGEAKNGEALLRFIDNLFAHPAFDEPDLSREETEGGSAIEFAVRVAYLPAVAQAAATLEELPAAAGAVTPEEVEPPIRYPMEEEN